MKALRTPDHRHEGDFTRANAWYQNLDLWSDPAAKFKLEYAESMYAEAQADLRNIDGKAESMLQFAIGGIAALVTLVTTVDALRPLVGWFLPSIGCLVLCVVFGLLSRKRVIAAGRMSVAHVVEQKTDDVQQLQLLIAAAAHCAIEGTKAMSDHKAKWFDRSTWAAVAAAICLLLPIVALIIS